MSQFARFITRFFLIFLVAGVFLTVPARANAQGTQTWTGVCVGDLPEESDVATIQGVQCVIANILSIAVSVIGLAGFVMFIIGSFNYLLSGGNAKGTEGARNTFTYAIVGIVVALSAVIILRLVASFTGVSQILNFQIPNSTQNFN